MPDGFAIRPGGDGDRAALAILYPRAFPGEDLLPLVRDLLDEADDVVSLVAMGNGRVLGHAVFTRCEASREAGGIRHVALLGPLAVDPDHQRRGIGTALLREGMERLRAEGVERVCLLGDPAYYARHGFRPETAIEPPYALPPEWAPAWQSLGLVDEPQAERRPSAPVRPSASVRLRVPEPWRRPEYWAP